MLAQYGGDSFRSILNDCLQGLKIAVEYNMPANIKGKKSKERQFYHAKDNAVSAIGKIIKYQHNAIDMNQMVSNWLTLLPIKHDVEEA